MKGSTYFAIGLSVLGILTIVFSLQIRHARAMYLPLGVGVLIAVLALARAGVELKETMAEKKAGKVTNILPEVPRNILIMTAWCLGFLVAVYLLGFPLAIFLFVAAYFKIAHRGWGGSIIFGLVMTVVIYVLFDYILRVPLYHGILGIPYYLIPER